MRRAIHASRLSFVLRMPVRAWRETSTYLSLYQMNRIYRLVLIALPCAFILSSCSFDKTSPVTPAPLAVTSAASPNGMTHTDEPFKTWVWVPCANGGVGEEVIIEGVWSVDQQILENKDGCRKYNFHMTWKKATGTGVTTGTTYTVQYGAHTLQFDKSVCADACPSTLTGTFNLGIRGKGSAENYTVHQNVRLVIDCDGSYNVVVENYRVTCD